MWTHCGGTDRKVKMFYVLGRRASTLLWVCQFCQLSHGVSTNETSFLSRVLFVFVPVCVVIFGVIAVWQSNLAPMIHTAAIVKMDPAAVLRNTIVLQQNYILERVISVHE